MVSRTSDHDQASRVTTRQAEIAAWHLEGLVRQMGEITNQPVGKLRSLRTRGFPRQRAGGGQEGREQVGVGAAGSAGLRENTAAQQPGTSNHPRIYSAG